MTTTHGSRDPADPISPLLTRVLGAPLPQQSEALDAMCALHPDCASALRQAYDSLKQLDLVRVAHSDGAGATAALPGLGGLPRALGPFRLLEFLGAGGMGAVYRAEDTELARPVALKLIRGELLASDHARARFQRESAALARLDHPGLCTVYRAGTTDGQPWIAMRLVRGTTLAQRIEAERDAAASQATPSGRKGSGQQREELQRTLVLFEKIARALATAHAAGVVHRDLKPANLVLTADDEPVVIDFGLVHLADSDAHLTMSGDHIGTPAYMAPEQVAARGREVTPATDVYALAVTLFETLTARSPYDAWSREQLFVAITRGERRRLRQARRGLPADLEVVIEKALDLDPSRRYAGMLAFADDLRRVRLHEPPVAKRLGWPLRAYRWCQRNPVAATFLTLLSAGLVVVGILDASRQAARQRSLAMAYGNLAGQLLADSPEHALELALRGVDLAPADPEALGTVLQTLQDIHPHTSLFLPWPKEPRVTVGRVAASPRGDAALIVGRYPQQGAYPAPVLWQSGKCTLLDDKGAYDAVWSPDGTQFLTTTPFASPRLWSATGEPLAILLPPDAPPDLRMPRARYLSDGQHIVFACSDGIARLHDLRTNTWRGLEPTLCAVSEGMRGVAVSADGKRLALGDNSGRIVVHDVADLLAGKDGQVLVETGTEVHELDLGNNGDLIQVTRINPDCCAIWSWHGKRLEKWGSRDRPATAVPLDPTANRVLACAQDHRPQLWELVDGKLVFRHEIARHGGQIVAASHAGDGRVMTLGVDGTAQFSNVKTGSTDLVLRGFPYELRAGTFLGSSRRCLLVTTNRVDEFDLTPVSGPTLGVTAFADQHACFVGPEWQGMVVTADRAQSLTLHDAEGHTVRTHGDPFGRRAGLRQSNDGKWLVSTSHRLSRQTEARIYGPGFTLAQRLSDLDMDNPEPVFGPDAALLLVDTGNNSNGGCTLYGRDGNGSWQRAPEDIQMGFRQACSGALAVVYHPHTATLAVARTGAGVRLFHWSMDPPELRPLQTLAAGLSPWLFEFSADGHLLLLACTDRVVRLVDRADTLLAKLSGHLGTIASIGISPRGDRLLVAATDSGITVHDLEGRLILPIRTAGSMTLARFLPDGDRVLFGDTSRTMRIVPIDREAILGLARRVQIPAMSEDHDRHYRSRVGDERDH
jgi:WD40 repeat protein/tRNA A-37 threonylcarbamoyl transferase component Bud32